MRIVHFDQMQLCHRTIILSHGLSLELHHILPADHVQPIIKKRGLLSTARCHLPQITKTLRRTGIFRISECTERKLISIFHWRDSSVSHPEVADMIRHGRPIWFVLLGFSLLSFFQLAVSDLRVEYDLCVSFLAKRKVASLNHPATLPIQLIAPHQQKWISEILFSKNKLRE